MYYTFVEIEIVLSSLLIFVSLIDTLSMTLLFGQRHLSMNTQNKQTPIHMNIAIVIL